MSAWFAAISWLVCVGAAPKAPRPQVPAPVPSTRSVAPSANVAERPPAATPLGELKLTMRQAVQSVVSSNADVEVARAQLQSLRALVDAASAAFSPYVSLLASGRATADPSVNQFYLLPRDTVRGHQSLSTLGVGGRLSFGLE